MARKSKTKTTAGKAKAPKAGVTDLFGKALPKRNTSELEDDAQARVVEMLRKAARPGVLWFAIPNGGLRSRKTAKRLKATGTRAGIPDMAFVIEGRTHLLELKRAKGGVLSEAQRMMRDQALASGAVWEMAKGFDQAMTVLAGWGVL